jgi:nucleoside-diphosphate-sugar epimerase
MSRSVAVLGANGFIGTRTVELMHLSGWADVRPVVRRAAALASPSRFALDGRVADARNTQALISAFTGCDYVVHAVAGDPRLIIDSIEPVYRAADVAKVRRLIYLSSAAVHGQSPPPGTDETSALSDHQKIHYNNAKVRAERQLWKLRQTHRVEVVILRPGIVFGPRSQWTGGFANELLAQTAYLVEGGQGICNSAYIDNVVHAIQLAIETSIADGRTYLIADAERVTWAEFCQPIADALGFDLTEISVSAPTFRREWTRGFRNSQAFRWLRGALPKAVRQSLKAGYAEWLRHVAKSEVRPRLDVTEELALLHCCRTKLPFTKAERELNYRPIVSFEEACLRSVRWLTFAGYPTVQTWH